jgi:hypothetical protein
MRPHYMCSTRGRARCQNLLHRPGRWGADGQSRRREYMYSTRNAHPACGWCGRREFRREHFYSLLGATSFGSSPPNSIRLRTVSRKLSCNPRNSMPVSLRIRSLRSCNPDQIRSRSGVRPAHKQNQSQFQCSVARAARAGRHAAINPIVMSRARPWLAVAERTDCEFGWRRLAGARGDLALLLRCGTRRSCGT